eukprot:CAMPEP_0113458602 /NCGR_PEP_ID=MMETSP0014_2-20120614/10008_1 /TAXON_ID=2857 /ORGANISM="Nitzschia sp." /LENGTH=306 /DNA_ID=CAMNT_0000350133 /DNA_START=236 /DNA_END=1156 /DNA_ORIENTATION=- /assembly_acc=CAM_ASM_000159
MKFSLAAILAVGAVAPVTSFSYLESLGSTATSMAPPQMAPPPVAASPPAPAQQDAPFFFTNGAQDEPADSPAFFFTGSSDASGPAAVSTGNYLEHLSAGATTVSGPGMASYLDALPMNSGASGPGISSYASSLNQDAAYYVAEAVASAPEPAAPAAPSDFSSDPAPVAVSAGNYLDALAGGASSTSGPGITSYLDALPQAATLSGGAGISTYISTMTTSNTVSGPGVPTYTDALSGGSSVSSSKTYSPFGGAKSSASSSGSPAFAIGSVTGRFDFTLEASPELVEQLKANAGRRVTLTGRITSWSS